MNVSLLIIFLFRAEASFIEIPFVADSAGNTPFAIKIKATELDSVDTTYKFCIWVYDKGKGIPISQIWTPDGWKYGWFNYQHFYQKTGTERTQWVYLKVCKQHTPDSFYIKFKLKNGDTVETLSTEFNIMDMQTEAGWLCGTVYKDENFSSPYENINIILRDASGECLGAYISEDNKINEGNLTIAGKFCIAVPIGEIDSIEFQDSLGNFINGYVTKKPPYNITAGETTYIDLFYINRIEFVPDKPNPGDSVIIYAYICNTYEELNNVEVSATYKKGSKTGLIDKKTINLPANSCTPVQIIWRDIKIGKYLIEITVRTENFSSKTTKYIGIGSGDVIINEIMYKPKNSGEWIEIFNRTNNPINIKNWLIDDVLITQEDYYIEPNNFVVIAESTENVLNSIYGNIPAKIFSLTNKFPNLNNEGDSITLCDNDSVIQDFLNYKPSWGNNKYGVSLERINPKIWTQDSTNWGSCIVSSGGTPGKINSIYAEFLPKKISLSIEPQIFSPPNEVTFISYTLPFTKANIRLYIYDKCGRLVRKLIDGEPSGSQSRYIEEKNSVTWVHIWNGKNDKGEILPTGIYIVYLEARNATSSISKKEQVVIAK